MILDRLAQMKIVTLAGKAVNWSLLMSVACMLAKLSIWLMVSERLNLRTHLLPLGNLTARVMMPASGSQNFGYLSLRGVLG